MSIGYVVAIVVDGRPVLFWREWNGHDPMKSQSGEWIKSASLATRSYSRESITDKYRAAGNSTLIPGFDVVVIEERVVTSVMTELAYERRRMRRIKMEAAD